MQRYLDLEVQQAESPRSRTADHKPGRLKGLQVEICNGVTGFTYRVHVIISQASIYSCSIVVTWLCGVNSLYSKCFLLPKPNISGNALMKNFSKLTF